MNPRVFADVSWVNIQGVPDQDGSCYLNKWESIFLSESVPDLQSIRLRDPDTFVVGGLHCNPGFTGSLSLKVILRLT